MWQCVAVVRDGHGHMGWLRLAGSLKSYVSFAREPYERDDILQKRPILQRSLLTVATPYQYSSRFVWKRIAEYRLFYRALLQKRLIILRSLLTVATPYQYSMHL